MIETDDDIPVALSSRAAPAAPSARSAPALMNFDEKLDIARTAVNTDAKRVAQVVRSMVESDG